MAELTLVIGLTIMLLVVAPQAALIAVLVLGPTVWLLLRVAQPRLKLLGRQYQESRKGSLQAMQQALGGIPHIRLLGVEHHFAGSFAANRRVMSRTDYLKTALAELPGPSSRRPSCSSSWWYSPSP